MADGSLDQTRGNVKKAAGELSGDEEMRNEGRVDKASGTVKEKVGNAADKAKRALRRD